MISKKKAIIGAMVLILVTGILTFTVTTITQLSIGDKVVISKSDAEYFKQYSKMLGLREYIEKNYYQSVKKKDIDEGILKGMFTGLNDPYSVYMNPREFSKFMEHTAGSYGGVGIWMTPGKDGLITVVTPIEDTPGEKAGILPGDKIVKVDGKEVFANSEKEVDDAVAMIKGKPGTKVTLSVKREGKKDVFEVNMTREDIRLKTVKSRVLQDGLGYIRITMFDEKTSKDFSDQLKELNKKGIKGLVIDLRNNPGGLLSECVKIADEILGEQTIVYTKNRAGEKEYEKSDSNGVDYPFTLLVNGGSASASEILSGAVKDTHSGTLIGTKTFGKGIVQEIRSLKDGSGFKLTTAQYFTPNGTYIHGKGIEPDIKVELPKELKEKIQLTDEEDVQLQKAIEVLKNKLQ